MPKVLTNNGFKSYDDVLVTLDKKEKIYSLETCVFITLKENVSLSKKDVKNN